MRKSILPLAAIAAAIPLSACVAAKPAAIRDAVTPQPAASTPAGKPACAGDVVRIGWYDETDCDVRPPQRLDLVLTMTDLDSVSFVNGLRQECAQSGGTYGEDSIRDEYLCLGIDY